VAALSIVLSAEKGVEHKGNIQAKSQALAQALIAGAGFWKQPGSTMVPRPRRIP
jgi:hypothetical protein